LICQHCFFRSKEMLYSGSRFRMAADRQETYLRQLLEAHALAPNRSSPGGAADYQDIHTTHRDFDGLVRLVKARQ